MKSMFVVLAAMALAACGTISDGTPRTIAATAEDLRWIDTLRELDEKADIVVGAANFQSSRKELGTFADAAAHAHKERTEELKAWRASSFATAPTAVQLPPCGQSDFRVAPKASDIEIIDVFIAHRECALGYVNEAQATVKATSAQHLLDKAARTFEAELQQLRTWRTSWQ